MPIEYEKDQASPETFQATETPEWSVILEAPDYVKLLRPVSTPAAKEYETKVLSVLKEVLRYRLTPEGLPDAAAILTYGPDFAARAGTLADHDKRVAYAIDVLTAPDSPWLMFALISLPFIGQLFRNHESQVKAIPANLKKSRAERKAEKAARPRAEVHIPGTKRTLKVPFRLHLPLGMFRASTQDPRVLVNQVLSNPDIRKGLHKAYGVQFGSNGAPDA